MERKLKLPFLWLLLCLLLPSCVEEKQKNNLPLERPLRVVCTTSFIGDAVRILADEHVELTVLMNPNTDPHSYKATIHDIIALQEADLILYHGLHLEGKMTEVLRALADRQAVVAVAETLPKSDLRPIDEHLYDPHIWNNVRLWEKVVVAICEQLTQSLPHQKQSIEQKKEAYCKELQRLDYQIRKKIATIHPDRRILITSHDAFYYYGEAYNIEVLPLMGVSTAVEAGLSDINRMVETIYNGKIKAIFVEHSVSDRTIRSIIEGCQKRGHNVLLGGSLYTDALGRPHSGADTYIGMMETNTRIIQEALR
jgi:manganese/zinc/iron transport system substrate-binding protein